MARPKFPKESKEPSVVVAFPDDKVAHIQMHKYLTERGITPESADICGLELMLTKDFQKIIGNRIPTAYEFCFAIPHVNGEYVVARMLGDRLKVKSKMRKSLCPASEVREPQIYCPPLSQKGHRLYVTESHLKAVAIAQLGYRAVAGIGVNGLCTTTGFRNGWPDDLIASGVITEIWTLMDSDWCDNDRVSAAIHQVVTMVQNLYPKLKIFEKQLPQHEGKNQGIDDYLAREGEAGAEWLASTDDLVSPEDSEFNQHLVELNAKYVICRDTHNIIDMVERKPIPRHTFTQQNEANRIYTGWVPSGKGFRPVEKSASVEWLKSKMRREVDREVYAPGSEGFGELQGKSFYNTWLDDGVVSVEGDATWFFNMLKNSVPDKEERLPFIYSVAWMAQNRGTRLKKCFSLVGPEQGTGKSLTMEILKLVFGESNSSFISGENFGNKFNSSKGGAELLIIDDADKLPSKSKGLFKNFVTGDSFMMERKGKDVTKQKNTAVLFITSNEIDHLPLDINDRRVHVVTYSPKVLWDRDDKRWADIWDKVEEGAVDMAAVGAVRWELENMDLDAVKYNPNFMPTMTKTKLKMAMDAMSDEAEWIEAMRHDVNEELGSNKRSFYTIEELCIVYHGSVFDEWPDGEREKARKRMTLAVKKWYSKIGQAAIRTTNGRLRYWGIRCDGTEADVKADVKKYSQLTVVQI